MTILCIETSTSVCSATICQGDTLIKQCINYEGSNHARLLPLYIDELLKLAREQHLTIDAVALSEGPGSYTGLRIGTATAKGLCYGLNIPLIPVPRDARTAATHNQNFLLFSFSIFLSSDFLFRVPNDRRYNGLRTRQTIN